MLHYIDCIPPFLLLLGLCCFVVSYFFNQVLRVVAFTVDLPRKQQVPEIASPLCDKVVAKRKSP